MLYILFLLSSILSVWPTNGFITHLGCTFTFQFKSYSVIAYFARTVRIVCAVKRFYLMLKPSLKYTEDKN